MRLLILFISFLISQIADSQIISASPPYRVRATASCSKLLDQYSGAAAAYSLRLLDCQYAGSAIRVRRSSDNTEQDIGFTAGGDLDTASLKTFVGTGGTDDGFVVTWYDQSGNTRNATQATSGNQPKIMDNGVIERLNGTPTIYFTGGSKSLQRASFLSGSSATAYVAAKGDSDPTTCNACGAFLNYGGSPDMSHQPYSDGNIYDDFSSTVRKSTGNPSTSLASPFLYCVISAANDWRSYINNSLHYSTSTNTFNVTGGVFIGSSDVTTTYYAGRISEVVIYNTTSSDGDRNGISGNINTYYTIY